MQAFNTRDEMAFRDTQSADRGIQICAFIPEQEH